MAQPKRERKENMFDKKTVSIRRVAKVTKGAKRLRFSAMVVVGDHNGSVGVGLGRGVDTRSAVEKGERVAIKSMTKIQLAGDTIPHEVLYKNGAAKVLLRPARLGTGVIAGSAVRTVLELAGIENVYGKLIGTTDSIATAYATFGALKSLRNKRVLSKMRNMRERVELKKETDKERKIREEKRRAKKKLEKKEDKKGTARGRKPKKESKKIK